MKYPMSRSEVKDIVNEICLYCKRYKNAHLGECDGCLGLDVKWGNEDGEKDGENDQ